MPLNILANLPKFDWKMINSFLPVTVIAAIIIFAARELLESRRRKKSSARQKRAYRELLKEEIERNNWAVKILKGFCSQIDQASKKPDGTIFFIETEIDGSHVFRWGEKIDLETSGGMPVPKVYRNIYDRLLPQIAINDEKLFEIVRETYDEIINLEHIKRSLVEFVGSGQKYNPELLATFADYGLAELPDVEEALKKLYFECTGQVLERRRIR